MIRKRTLLNLTHLEDRLTPAVTVTLINGTLNVRGDNAANAIAITANSGNSIRVVDNGVIVGNFVGVVNISVTAGPAADAVTVDLSGLQLAGNVSVNTGNAPSGSGDQVTISDGTIQGKLTITTGTGADNITLGGPVPLVVNGSNSSFTMGSGVDTLTILGGSSIAGPISYSGVNNLNLGGIMSGFVVNGGSEGLGVNFTLAASAVVNGSLTIIGGSTAVDTVVINGTVTGSLIVTLGQGANNLTLSNNALIEGGLTYSGGGGVDNVAMTTGARVAGNASFNVGDGNNLYNFSDKTAAVDGNFSINAGSGLDNVGTFSTSVDGSGTFLVGNGDNSINFDGFIGNGVFWQSGGGRDEVAISDAPLQLRLYMGTGDDTVDVTTSDPINLFVEFDDNSDTIVIPPTVGSVTIIHK